MRCRPPSVGVHSRQMGWTGRETRTGLWSWSHTGLPDVVDRRCLGRSGLIRSEDGTAGGSKTPSGKSVSREAATRWDGLRRDNQWDIPQKRTLFTSDGPDSTTSGSDIPEGHSDRPPEVEYSSILISGRPQDEGGTEGLRSPTRQLEIAVVRLQKDIDVCRTELELTRKQTPAVTPRPPRRSGFTSTPVPRYSGKSNWEQYRQVFEAIVCSNGWDDVTAALQLLSHLDGDTLNVALLVLEARRVDF